MPQPRFELPPQYDPHAVERRLYQRWLDRGVFTARADSSREPYVIVMPPPNITAILHTGQGLNNVIQDVLIRFERMRAREAEWLREPTTPGSPPRTSSNDSSPRRERPGSTSGATRSSSGYGRSCGRRGTPSSSSSR